MSTYAVQSDGAPTGSVVTVSALGAVAYELTSGASGTELTGVGSYLVITSDTAGWAHVGTSDTDVADDTKTHRVLANLPLSLGGVRKGLYVSFLADGA